jgi:hypothetical protein
MPVVIPGGSGAGLGTSDNPSVATSARWTLDVDEICQAAFRRVGGEQTKAYELRSARDALQFVFQRFMLRGVNLWTLEQTTVTLAAGQAMPIRLAFDTTDIVEAVYRDTQQTTVSDIAVQRLSRGEYHYLPDKTTQGFPTSLYIDRQRDAPELYVWPVPNRAGYELRFWAIKKIRDITSMVDNVDAPVRWIPAIVAGLAWYLSLERRGTLTIDDRQELKAEFEQEFAEAMGEDRDNVPIRAVVDLSCYGRT